MPKRSAHRSSPPMFRCARRPRPVRAGSGSASSRVIVSAAFNASRHEQGGNPSLAYMLVDTPRTSRWEPHREAAGREVARHPARRVEVVSFGVTRRPRRVHAQARDPDTTTGRTAASSTRLPRRSAARGRWNFGTFRSPSRAGRARRRRGRSQRQAWPATAWSDTSRCTWKRPISSRR